MASFAFSTLQTTGQTLNGFDTGFITATGALIVANGSGVFMASSATVLSVVGSLACDFTAVSMSNGGRVNIGSTGFVNGGSDGILSNGATDVVNISNAGTITAGFSGLSLTNQSVRVMNSGSLSGFSSTGIYVDASANEHITNTGTIYGSNYGINTQGTAFEVIYNSGTISGFISALVLSEAGSIVTNAGALLGTSMLNGGADYFNGSQGVQGAVLGGIGNDTITGGAGYDSLGGDGDKDVLCGLGGGDDLLAGAGADTVGGGDGDDTITGDIGNDVLRGGAGDDRMAGDADNDVLTGGAGDDSADGGAGLDSIYGGEGDDFLTGQAGVDVLLGGEGNDTLYGGAGNDTLRGGAGDDVLTDTAGADTFAFARNQGTDRVTAFTNDVDKLDLRAFDFGTVAAVAAVSSASSFGLRIDVPGEGVIFVVGLTLATLTAPPSPRR